MEKRKITIGICSIGSGVGQSVIESCRLSSLPLRTIGLGNSPLAFGYVDCDEFAHIPSYYDEAYLESLFDLAKKKNIDLLIPGHDDEALLLSEHSTKFATAGIHIVSSSRRFHQICRDKCTIRTSINPDDETLIPGFAAEYFRVNYHKVGFPFPFISKPRDGFASKNVTLIQSPNDLSKIRENDVIQPLLRPRTSDPCRETFDAAIERGNILQVAEISIQLIIAKNGTLLGKIATRNSLYNGAPVEIVVHNNEHIWKAVDRLLPYLVKAGASGPVNLQGRLTDQGLRIFEINPRFTGITATRAKMGFNEVDACIRHWLGLKSSRKLDVNPNRIALRHHISRIIPDEQIDLFEDRGHNASSTADGRRPILLITGSTGEIGKQLLRKLHEAGYYQCITLDRCKEKARKEFELLNDIQHFDWSDLQHDSIDFASVDRILHLASARPHQSDDELALSLQRTCQLFDTAATFSVQAIINISSQAVYTNQSGTLLDETDPPRPSTPYGMMKYAIEMHLESLTKFHRGLKATSIRLETITGRMCTSYATEFVSRMVKRCVDERRITIHGNESIHARLDICDAVNGISAIAHSDRNTWQPTYNLGSGNQFQLAEIAEMIKMEVLRVQPERTIAISQIPGQRIMKFGMNAEKFQLDFNWQPEVSLKQSIRRLVVQCLNDKEKS